MTWRAWSWVGVAAGCCLTLIAASGRRAAPAAATAPTLASPATGPVQDVRQEMAAIARELRRVLSPPVLADPARRRDAAPAAIPLLRRHVGLAREAAQADPKAANYAAFVRTRSLALLALLDDAQAKAELDAAAADPDPAEVRRAAAVRLLVRWFGAGEDDAARSSILDDAAKAAAASPDSEHLTHALAEVTRSPRMLTAQRDRARRIMADHLKGPAADAVREDFAAAARLAALEGKPLVLAGVRHDGTPFTTADLKGKVILVDFWATWCVPCVADLPRVKQAYAEHHANGLEVVSVSCDEDPAALEAYLAENPDMPWPQLFDAKKPGWHALATEYGIRAIPAKFLIDKRGVVRSVTAREVFEEMIPKLLAEPAAAASQPAGVP